MNKVNSPSERLNVMRGIHADMLHTYEVKNNLYGNSFSNTRREVPFYTLGKLSDKYNRYKNIILNPTPTPTPHETVVDTLFDLANYCIMEIAELEMEIDNKHAAVPDCGEL